MSGAPDYRGSPSRAGAFNRVERFRDDMRAINKRWEQLTVLEGVSLADQYLQHGLNVAALFKKVPDGAKLICLVSRGVEESEIGGERLAFTNDLRPVSGELGEQKQVPVLVRVGQSIEAPNWVIPSLGRLYFVEDYFGEVTAGPLYRSKRTGFYESIPCLSDGESRSRVSSLHAVENIASGVVEGGSKDLGRGTGQQDYVGINGCESACLDPGLDCLYVSLAGNDVSVGFDVAFDSQLELIDVMVGPFDF